jgi:hypothetical protein
VDKHELRIPLRIADTLKIGEQEAAVTTIGIYAPETHNLLSTEI